jgi:hypothetical protein
MPFDLNKFKKKSKPPEGKKKDNFKSKMDTGPSTSFKKKFGVMK